MTTALIVPFGADDTEIGRARQAIWNRCYRLWAAPNGENGSPLHHLIVAGDPLFGTPAPDALEPLPRAGEPLRTHPFSVARAVNRAVRLAPPEVDRFVCIGADALPDWRVVDWASAELDSRPWTLLFSKGASLCQGCTDDFVAGIASDDTCADVQPHPTPTVGPIAFTREAFLAVRGFDERFEGWGYEDVDLWSRLKTTHATRQTVESRTSPYPLIQFSHPVTHHDLTSANPNVRLWNRKCAQGGGRNDHPATQLFGLASGDYGA